MSLEQRFEAVRGLIADCLGVVGSGCRGKLVQLDQEFERLTNEMAVLKMVAGEPSLVEDEDWLKWGLTKTEIKALSAIRRAGDKGLRKESWLATMYADKPDQDWPEVKLIDVFVCKLRKKLAAANAPFWIETVWGEGYRYREGAFPASECTAPDGRILYRPPSPYYASNKQKNLKSRSPHKVAA